MGPPEKGHPDHQKPGGFLSPKGLLAQNIAGESTVKDHQAFDSQQSRCQSAQNEADVALDPSYQPRPSGALAIEDVLLLYPGSSLYLDHVSNLHHG